MTLSSSSYLCQIRKRTRACLPLQDADSTSNSLLSFAVVSQFQKGTLKNGVKGLHGFSAERYLCKKQVFFDETLQNNLLTNTWLKFAFHESSEAITLSNLLVSSDPFAFRSVQFGKPEDDPTTDGAGSGQ